LKYSHSFKKLKLILPNANDHELGFIIIYIVNVTEINYQVCIFCPNGRVTSQILIEQVRKLIDDEITIEIVPLVKISQYELCISSVELTEKNTLHVSNILTLNDKINILTAISEIEK